MSDFVFNSGKGRARAYAENVENNSPVAAVLRLFIFNMSGVEATVEAAAIDVDNIAALQALPNLAEVTNANYANIALDEIDITITEDDANDRVDIFVSDQTFTAIAVGDAWTDAVLAYDPDGTDTDANTVLLSWHDFAATPNGSDITFDEGVNGVIQIT